MWNVSADVRQIQFQKNRMMHRRERRECFVCFRDFVRYERDSVGTIPWTVQTLIRPKELNLVVVVVVKVESRLPNNIIYMANCVKV